MTSGCAQTFEPAGVNPEQRGHVFLPLFSNNKKQNPKERFVMPVEPTKPDDTTNKRGSARKSKAKSLPLYEQLKNITRLRHSFQLQRTKDTTTSTDGKSEEPNEEVATTAPVQCDREIAPVEANEPHQDGHEETNDTLLSETVPPTSTTNIDGNKSHSPPSSAGPIDRDTTSAASMETPPVPVEPPISHVPGQMNKPQNDQEAETTTKSQAISDSSAPVSHIHSPSPANQFTISSASSSSSTTTTTTTTSGKQSSKSKISPTKRKRTTTKHATSPKATTRNNRSTKTRKAPSKRTESKRKSVDHGPWTCSKCTLENEPKARRCIVCQARKPIVTRKTTPVTPSPQEHASVASTLQQEPPKAVEHPSRPCDGGESTTTSSTKPSLKRRSKRTVTKKTAISSATATGSENDQTEKIQDNSLPPRLTDVPQNHPNKPLKANNKPRDDPTSLMPIQDETVVTKVDHAVPLNIASQTKGTPSGNQQHVATTSTTSNTTESTLAITTNPQGVATNSPESEPIINTSILASADRLDESVNMRDLREHLMQEFHFYCTQVREHYVEALQKTKDTMAKEFHQTQAFLDQQIHSLPVAPFIAASRYKRSNSVTNTAELLQTTTELGQEGATAGASENKTNDQVGALSISQGSGRSTSTVTGITTHMRKVSKVSGEKSMRKKQQNPSPESKLPGPSESSPNDKSTGMGSKPPTDESIPFCVECVAPTLPVTEGPEQPPTQKSTQDDLDGSQNLLEATQQHKSARDVSRSANWSSQDRCLNDKSNRGFAEPHNLQTGRPSSPSPLTDDSTSKEGRNAKDTTPPETEDEVSSRRSSKLRKLPLADLTNLPRDDNGNGTSTTKNITTRKGQAWVSNVPTRTFLREMATVQGKSPDKKRKRFGPFEQAKTDNTTTSSTWVSKRRRSAPSTTTRSETASGLWADLDHGSRNSAQPKPEATSNNGTEYKYQEVVRCKSERQGLPCRDCPECRAFYEVLRRSGDNLVNSQNTIQFSRHRARFTPPETPADFWELDFIDERRQGSSK